MAIERSTSFIQSQVAEKNFHNTEKETLRAVFDEIEKFSQSLEKESVKKNDIFSEKINLERSKSSFINR